MKRCLVLAAVLFAPAGTASPQQAYIGHMEGCFAWGIANGRIGARNECSRSINMKFMALADQHKVEADVPPGGWFDSGLRDSSAEFMFTSCPVGWEPSLKFTIENKMAIIVSLYNCRPAERPGA